MQSDDTVFARSKGQLSDPVQAQIFAEAAAKADALLLSLHGGTASFPAWDDLAAALDERRAQHLPTPWIHIQPASRDDDAMLAAQNYASGLEDGSWAGLVKLLDAGGIENVVTALGVLAERGRGKNDPVPGPVEMPMQGICHPEVGTYTSLAGYRSHLKPGRPTIAITYPRAHWLTGNTAHIDALTAELERQGANVIPIFCYRLHDTRRGNDGINEVFDAFCREDGRPIVDAVISVYSMSVSMSDERAAQAYPELDVPVLHAMTSTVPREMWEPSKQGLTTADVATQAAQPEFDGCLITKMIACQEADEVNEYTGALTPKLIPLPGRVQAMATLAINWTRLRRKPNAEKKVAIVFHHHPPRNDRIGCASGLDSFESVRRLLARMAADGYQVPELFADADELANMMLAGLTCDGRWLTPEQMHDRAEAHADGPTAHRWYSELPARVRETMDKAWALHPGELFVHDGELSFAGHIDGNVLLTIQPPRGQFELVDDECLHDQIVPPPHHYLAHYRWIRDVFGADVAIHIGTHGSLEWLPGKALGMSEECYPELALENLPNIYPYIVNNPGEGTQAKRRSACALVDHLTPPMTEAGLYDETAELERALQEFDRASTNGRQAAALAVIQLWEAAKTSELASDLDLTRDDAFADPEEFASKLHHYLLELEDREIADGLHVLGSLVADGGDTGDGEVDPEALRARVAEYLAQLTRLPNGDIPSLRQAVLASWGTDLDECQAHAADFPLGQQKTGRQLIADAHQICVQMMGRLWDAQQEPENAQLLAERLATEVLGSPDPAVTEVLTWVQTGLLPNLLGVGDEIESIMHALDGGFVLPGPSGAPTRGHPEVLPTGRNFYSVDPTTLPTKTAWAEGSELADQLLARYAELHPESPYPRTVGIVVWGVAAMRTGAADIAEILALYGMRPRWESNGVVRDLEVIPLAELRRPRIDVSTRISGLFRDAFPNLVELVDRAARITAALDEPDDRNLLRAHVQADTVAMVARGIDPETSRRKASLRVFGCPPGTYGAGVSELVETKQWTTKEDLGNAYIAASAHAYGQGVYGDVEPELFKANLARMDATVKNEDTREYDMLSCTDFYNYYGGLIAAATTVRGTAPTSFVGDSSDPSRIATRTTTEEARRVLRSRILNPTWIEGLQRHGYKGAGDLSKVLDILIGWDATSDVVDDHLWTRVARRYALDPAMQQWFAKVNVHALHNIVDKLLDAAQRGLWDADEQIRDELEDLYGDIEGSIEDLSDDGIGDDNASSRSGGTGDTQIPSDISGLVAGVKPLNGRW